MTEVEFHKQRRLFVVHAPNCVSFAEPGFEGSHTDWFADWPEGGEPAPRISEHVRGYADATGLYFYLGKDFRGGTYVENMAHASVAAVRRLVGIEHPTFNTRLVFIGVRVGAPGERWEPLNRLDV